MDLERFVDSWLLVCLGFGTFVVGTERGWRFYRECSCPVTGSVIVGSWVSANSHGEPQVLTSVFVAPSIAATGHSGHRSKCLRHE